MRIFKKFVMLTMMAGALAAWQLAAAQDAPTTTPAPVTTPDPAQVPATTPAAMPTVTPAEQSPAAEPTPTVVAPAADAAPVTADVAKPAGKQGYVKVGKKEEWQGSNETLALAPTPMLDEEGKQRLDPDAKPMFNPPVLQQRDKHGHPLFDEKGKPVWQTAKDLGYDENGKKIKEEKVKPPKMTPVTVAGGTFTVDGIIGKAALNYDIADLKYIYLYAPGIGITVVSNAPFPGAKEQPNAFDGKTLTVVVEDHTLQLASEKNLMQTKKPESAFVLVDRDMTLPSKFPVVGYGTIRKPPYMWPGAKAQVVRAGAIVVPPPPPANLRPVMLLQPCPAGQMRKAGPPVLPGQVAPEQPCVAIPKATVVQAAKKPVATAAPKPPVEAATDAAPAAPATTNN